MTKCPLCGTQNAITLFTSTQCVGKNCHNYDASWEAEILDVGNFNVIRHNAIDPTGGGFSFKSHDDTRFVTQFDAQILFYARHNSYWSIPAHEVFADSDNIPTPDCYSTDSKVGSRFGKCNQCPYGMFGSAPNGTAKACRQQIKLYLRLPDFGDDPYILWVSPLNMNAFQNEFLIRDLNDRGTKYTKCLTTITSYTNSKADKFRRAKFEHNKDMSVDEVEIYNEYRQNWLDKIKYTHENPTY